MAIHPAELAKLSDKELGELLAPLFPAVRSPFAGSREKLVTLPSGAKTSKRGLDKSAQMLASVLANVQRQAEPAANPNQPLTFQSQPLKTLPSRHEHTIRP